METFRQEAMWTVRVGWGSGSVDSGPSNAAHGPATPYLPSHFPLSLVALTWHMGGWVSLTLSEIQYRNLAATWLYASLSHSFLTCYMHMGIPHWSQNKSLSWGVFSSTILVPLTTDRQCSSLRKQSNSKSQILIGCHRAQNVTYTR